MLHILILPRSLKVFSCYHPRNLSAKIPTKTMHRVTPPQTIIETRLLINPTWQTKLYPNFLAEEKFL